MGLTAGIGRASIPSMSLESEPEHASTAEPEHAGAPEPEHAGAPEPGHAGAPGPSGAPRAGAVWSARAPARRSGGDPRGSAPTAARADVDHWPPRPGYHRGRGPRNRHQPRPGLAPPAAAGQVRLRRAG